MHTRMHERCGSVRPAEYQYQIYLLLIGYETTSMCPTTYMSLSQIY